MTVLDAISAATGLDQDKASAAAGAILAAIRMSAPGEPFAPIERAIPDAKTMILNAGSVMGGGRTGEMMAMVSELKSPAGVAKLTGQLARAGLNGDQIAQTAKALIGYVQEKEGPAALTPLLDALPAFRDLVK